MDTIEKFPKTKRSHYPSNRPTYKQWVKDLKINEVTYKYHPEAKQKADSINQNIGIYVDDSSIWQKLIGKDKKYE
tara:strand:+ start:152 stop:376 length:225 start_codon:yes stop_codon:yes gene_type:complete